MRGHILAFPGAALLGGCAAIDTNDGLLPQPDEVALHAYHAVRTDGALHAHGAGMIFCASRSGIRARSESRGSDDWSAAIDEGEVQSRVCDALEGDPEVRKEPIHADVVKGEAFLYGKVSSDLHATLAIHDALRVIGVAAVHANLLTPESPTPMPPHPNASCE